MLLKRAPTRAQSLEPHRPDSEAGVHLPPGAGLTQSRGRSAPCPPPPRSPRPARLRAAPPARAPPRAGAEAADRQACSAGPGRGPALTHGGGAERPGRRAGRGAPRAGRRGGRRRRRGTGASRVPGERPERRRRGTLGGGRRGGAGGRQEEPDGRPRLRGAWLRGPSRPSAPRPASRVSRPAKLTRRLAERRLHPATRGVRRKGARRSPPPHPVPQRPQPPRHLT